MDAEQAGELIVVPEGIVRELPPILAGTTPDQVEARVERFFLSVAQIFEAWVARRSSKHTQRAYRQDVMAFIAFRQIPWPDQAITSCRPRWPTSTPGATSSSPTAPRPKPSTDGSLR